MQTAIYDEAVTRLGYSVSHHGFEHIVIQCDVLGCDVYSEGTVDPLESFVDREGIWIVVDNVVRIMAHPEKVLREVVRHMLSDIEDLNLRLFLPMR